ncbi:MAG: hypothetical protein GY714_01495 [Desulfobacterales bacterium]|nr:hypothetical protein [Desulfobacterales bacterium]
MSSYYNYKFRTHGLQSIFKKYGDKRTAKEIWGIALDAHKNNGGDIEVFCMAEECVALAETPEFLFIDSVRLAEVIKRSKFNAESIALDEGITFLSFPKGFKIDGYPASGVMFGWGDFDARNLWLNTMQVNAGWPITGYEFPENVTGYVSFSYQSPVEKDVTCRLQIPFEKLGKFIATDTVEEMRAALDDRVLGLQLDDEDYEYQLHICHITLKAMVYAQALPEKVVRGVPDKRAGNNKFKPSGHIIKASDNLGSESAPTEVGYHFRQLRHEKYYKGENKNKQIGSRWIFIPPYEKGMKAKTINE